MEKMPTKAQAKVLISLERGLATLRRTARFDVIFRCRGMGWIVQSEDRLPNGLYGWQLTDSGRDVLRRWKEAHGKDPD